MNLKKITILLTILVVLISCNNDEKTTIKKEVDSVEIQTLNESDTIEDKVNKITVIEENDVEDTVKYDKVIAYDFEGYGDNDIVSKGKLIEKPKIYLEKELTLEEVKQLESIIHKKNTYGGISAFCYDPHFGVVYYKKNKIVNYFSVCLQCNLLYSSFEIPAKKLHKSTVCDDCYDQGLSKKARKQFSEFIKDLGFGHWELFD
jgi:hypothetical protein